MRRLVRFRLFALIAVIVPLLSIAGVSAPLAAQEPDFPPPLTERFALPDADRILSLSPDGTMAVAIGGDRDTLCTYTVPAGDEVACADLAEHGIRLRPEDVAWSPDSHTLAFAENALQMFVDGDLWLMDAASGELTNLTDDGFEGGLPFLDEDQPE